MGRAPPLAFPFSAFPPPPAGKGQILAAARPRPAPPPTLRKSAGPPARLPPTRSAHSYARAHASGTHPDPSTGASTPTQTRAQADPRVQDVHKTPRVLHGPARAHRYTRALAQAGSLSQQVKENAIQRWMEATLAKPPGSAKAARQRLRRVGNRRTLRPHHGSGCPGGEDSPRSPARCPSSLHWSRTSTCGSLVRHHCTRTADGGGPEPAGTVSPRGEAAESWTLLQPQTTGHNQWSQMCQAALLRGDGVTLAVHSRDLCIQA